MSLNPGGTNIATIAGPPFVSVILNWGLFGVLSTQIYLYFQAFPNDKPWLKALVWAVYLLEMIQTFLLTDTMWNYFVSGFGNIEAMDEVGTTWLSVCVIGGLMGFLVQWFYAYRIVVVARKWVIPGFIAFTSLISLAGAIATAISLNRAGKISKLLADQQLAFTVVGVWVGTGTVCNTLIAVFKCFYLHRCRCTFHPYGKFSQTEALMSKLVLMTIETGVLNAIISTLSLALFYPSKLQRFTYFVVPLCVHTKFYSTTTLAVLNSRMKPGTWRDNELVFVPPQDTNRVELNINSTEGSVQNTCVLVTKEEVIAIDHEKSPNLPHPMH